MARYSDLVKVKTYEQRQQILRLEAEIKQIKEEILKQLFPNETRVYYYSYVEDLNISGIVVEARNESVKIKVDKIDGYEVEKYYTLVNPNELCKGEY